MSFIVSATDYGYARTKFVPDSFVRVTVTAQTHSFVRPWEKKHPRSRTGIGVVISPNRILVTAQLIANSTFVQLEKIGNGVKCPATVIQKDYAANLAVLAPDDITFLAKSAPVKMVSKRLKIGESLNIVQFEDNDTPILAEGELKGIEVNTYPFNVSSLLVFNVEVVLSDVGSRYTLPVLRRGKLVGLMMKYNKGAQTIKVIPPPVINHFLVDLYDNHYEGFPQAAFSFSTLEDPQLRRHLGLTDSDNGVFIDKVRPGGPADVAGLRDGDVLVAIDHFVIDKKGQYNDLDYGKLSVAHLTNTRSHAGDRKKFSVIREKKKLNIEVVLGTLRADEYPVPPFIMDRGPKYMVVGGLVFQELSQQYLKEWGGNWTTSAPQKLLYYQRNQWDHIEPGEKVVFLSQVLPSEGNIGYGQLNYAILERINGLKISSLQDVPGALKQPHSGFHKFEFEQDPNVIYLDAETLDQENKIIQNRYNLPTLFRLN